MPTILELFHSSGLKDSVKSDTETLVEQEVTGIRVKSAVELNNPLIYGNEAMRIANRSTPVLEDMKKGTEGSPGDGGLIGKGLDKISGGSVKSLGDVRDKINDKLGIPSNQIPSRIIGQIEGQTSDEPVVLGQNGTEVGKFLKETGGGNPSTLLKQAGGKLIGKAKDKLRGALFGEAPGIGENEVEPAVNVTNNETKYTDYKKSPEGGDIFSEDPKTALEGTKLDLSKVSPIYGLKRKDNNFYFGSTPGEKQVTSYAFIPKSDKELPANSPESTFTKGNEPDMSSIYKLSNGDGLNTIASSDEYKLDDTDSFIEYNGTVYKDFIPVWIKRHGDKNKPIVFRAIISGISETTSPDWSSNKFVGNPYAFYMYGGVERSVTFSLKLFASSPFELNGIWDRLKTLTSYAYPKIWGGLTTPPIIQFRIGSIYSGKEGFLESLQYTIPDESNWETDGSLGYLPKMVDVSTTIKFLESHGSEERLYDMTISKAAAQAINDKRQESADIEAERTGEQAQEIAKETAEKKVNVSVKQKTDKLKSLAGNKVQAAKDKARATIPSEGEDIPIKGQSGQADKLDGKSAPEATKETSQKSNIPEKQAEMVALYTMMGYKEITRNQAESFERTHKWMREDLGESKFFYKDDGRKYDVYQITSEGYNIRIEGGWVHNL